MRSCSGLDPHPNRLFTFLTRHRILWKPRMDCMDIYQRSILLSYWVYQIIPRCQIGLSNGFRKRAEWAGNYQREDKAAIIFTPGGYWLAFIFLFVQPCAERRPRGRLVIDVCMFVPLFCANAMESVRKKALIYRYTVQKDEEEKKRERERKKKEHLI